MDITSQLINIIDKLHELIEKNERQKCPPPKKKKEHDTFGKIKADMLNHRNMIIRQLGEDLRKDTALQIYARVVVFALYAKELDKLIDHDDEEDILRFGQRLQDRIKYFFLRKMD